MKKQITKNPLVSIIMPVYNAQKYIDEALISVLRQTYKNWELIAVDDGSVDASLKILRQYARQDKRIKVYKNKKNLGVSKTSNYAISKAKGKFITRFDSDDIMPENRLELQVRFLQKNKTTIVVGGQVEIMSAQGAKIGDKLFPIKHKDIYEGMFNMMTVQQGAMMVNATKLPHGFVWYKDNFKTAEEVDLFFRLFQYGKFANLSKTTLLYRQYGTSTSLKDPKTTFYNTYNVRKIATSFYGYKPTLKNSIISVLQYVFVSLMPAMLIYPIFSILRGINSFNLNLFSGYINQYNLLNAKRFA